MLSGRREIIVLRDVVPNLDEGALNAGAHPRQHVGNLRFAQSAGASAEIADPRNIRKPLGAAERERKHVARVIRRGGDYVVGRGELYCTLGMLIQNREILKMCIAIFDSARQREHREQLRKRGALVLARDKLRYARRNVFVGTVVAAMSPQAAQYAEVFASQVGAVRTPIEPS